MLSILGQGVRLCDGICRREALWVGSLGFAGLLWSDWLRGRADAGARKAASRSFAKARACIIIFNYGGPSHLDILDLKPDAPPEIRGEFKPSATSVPGIAITEHLPRLGRLANHYAIVRSVSHRDNDHAIGTYLTMTGYSHPKHDTLGIEPPASPSDMPAMGSVLSKLRRMSKPGFPYVTLGDLRHLGNHDSMGQVAGCLGRVYDPFTVPFARPLTETLDLEDVLSVLGTVDGRRVKGRRQLLAQIERRTAALEETATARNLDGFTRRAYELLASRASRDAFDLTREPARVRQRYGSTPFGQNCLLARRLVEAGVPMVTINSFAKRDWDTHSNNFRELKQTLLPPTDQGFSALLMDLHSRGLLEETLVVWMGDMGRTPRVNQGGGRDHWSFCYSILVAGGGIRGGQVYGASDRRGAYPSVNPVSPAEITATIYHLLGIDPGAHVMDQQGRPFVVSPGKPIRALAG
jgi:hypothetical protein